MHTHLLYVASLAACCGLGACHQDTPPAAVSDPVRHQQATIKKEYHPNGSVKAMGAVIKQQKEGMWIDYHWLEPDKIGRTEIYQHGKLHGQSISYYENGDTLLIGFYHNGKKEGLWRQFQGGHTLYSVGQYKNNKPIGEWQFYDETGNGTLMRRIRYEKGKEIILLDKYPPLPPH